MMQLDKVSLADSNAFSPSFIDYIQERETLRPFYNRFPAIASFEKQIAEKKSSFSSDIRTTLVNTLQRQYHDYTLDPAVEANISHLAHDNTFTVTTGHQLNIFTGPLYFVFKIVTVINACKKLKAQYPDYNFVPVYWMASEDHDYDEIKYFRLYGKKYVWNTDQQGAVGRFNTSGLEALAREIPGNADIFYNAYSQQKTLAQAARQYVNSLFGHEGLVVVDADDRSLKAHFSSMIRKDVLDNANKPLVEKTNEALEANGYKTQVFCREINFFYLEDGLRSRIEKQGDRYHVVDTSLSFTSEEIENMIRDSPERFSPNVILRPLYEEMILPNLAYVGGPAEVTYWLQLKDVFDSFNVPFPILLPRNFGMIVDHEVARKFSKTGLELKSLFEEKNYMFNHWVLTHSPRNLTVGDERTAVAEIFQTLMKKAKEIDTTLTAFVAAEEKRAINSLEKIERKYLRAEKRLHGDKLRQIEAVKDALFPNGNLQERTDNFLNFYQRDPKFIQHLLDNFDPFDFKFNILTYMS